MALKKPHSSRVIVPVICHGVHPLLLSDAVLHPHATEAMCSIPCRGKHTLWRSHLSSVADPPPLHRPKCLYKTCPMGARRPPPFAHTPGSDPGWTCPLRTSRPGCGSLKWRCGPPLHIASQSGPSYWLSHSAHHGRRWCHRRHHTEGKRCPSSMCVRGFRHACSYT
jgi:hypothetical protein